MSNTESRKEFDVVDIANSIASTMAKCGASLSDNQRMLFSGCLGVWLEKAYQEGWQASRANPIVLPKIMRSIPVASNEYWAVKEYRDRCKLSIAAAGYGCEI